VSRPDPGRSPWDPDPQTPPWAIRRLQALSRRSRVLIAVATLGVIVVAGIADGMTRGPELVQHVSDQGPAPALILPSVRNPAQKVTLTADAGHPVIVNFWGSWCGPCQDEMPLLAQAARAMGTSGRIKFLGIDLEDVHRSSAVAMMNRYGTPYPSGYDPDDSATSEFKVEGTPTTIFIDSKGHIAGRYAGALSATVLQFWIHQLS
jgi:cytochrome c biogenesis protein CcmG, thiol:disulfide interchange protein DsbE